MLAFDERIPSDTDPHRVYRIVGTLECDCIGFQTRGYCKHLRRKLEALLASRKGKKQ